jgi:hypothetical protein
MLAPVGLSEDLQRAATAAAAYAGPGEEVEGVLAAEPQAGTRVYLCAYSGTAGRSWLALDADGGVVADRALVREAASIAALCEIAEETSGGGDLQGLRAELRRLRLTENPEGIEEAEEAALELERVVGATPRLATPGYLDSVGGATRRLEHALGDAGVSPFSQAMGAAMGAVDELTGEIERTYKLELGG